jgi:virulence-associated protein VagC
MVVHAMLERRQRGQSLRLPRGVRLDELIPPERRHAARHDR